MANPLLKDIVVNGEVIPAATIAAEAQNHRAPADKPGLAWKAAGRALAVRTLLLQEARAAGVQATPQEVAPGKRETAEEAAIRALVEDRVAVPSPDDAVCHAFYEASPERFMSPRLHEAAHILFAAKAGDPMARTEAHTAALQTLAVLRDNPQAFERLARARSACPSRENGGRLGQLAQGDTVAEFEAALDALAEGEIAAQPVSTRFGFHIVRLDARAESRQLPFAAVRGQIAERLEKTAWAAAAKAFVAGLAAKAEIDGVDLDAAA